MPTEVPKAKPVDHGRNIKGIDPELWRMFRSACVLNNKPAGEVLNDLIKAWLAASVEGPRQGSRFRAPITDDPSADPTEEASKIKPEHLEPWLRPRPDR